jgi:hypothetical protein
VARRAAGRTRHNLARQFRAAERRVNVLRLFHELRGGYLMSEHAAYPLGGLLGWGIQAEIARRLGVHRSTVCRDLQAAIRRSGELGLCPLCERKTLYSRIKY